MDYKYIINISYDGSKFLGYGTQKHGKTVQDELERVLLLLNSNIKVKTFASSRTDSKVHALDQYVQFNLKKEYQEEDLMYKLNRMLNDSIHVKKVKKDFEDKINVRYDVIDKTYIYRINKIKNPFLNDYSNFIGEKLDVELMEKAAKYLEGTHDFTSLSNANTDVINKVRTINFIKIEEDFKSISFSINANGFLYNMVRIIVGLLLNVGRKNVEVDEMENIIKNKKRLSIAPCEKACGLYLEKINFGEKNV